MSKYWSTVTRGIDPYTAGEQPKDRKYIKLNTNENPYPPSPRVLTAIREAADDRLRLYPDPTCSELRAALAHQYALEPRNFFIGNGSDEVLAFAFRAFFDSDRTILFPQITYTFYPVYSSLFQLQYEWVPMDEEFHIPLEGFLRNNGGIVLPNPNAPTGRYIPLDDIRRIVEANTENVVIVDEAYIDFGGESALPLIREYPNLLVVHTLSKSRSLAGLRIGYAAGHEELIEGLERIRDSFNSYTLDRIALAAAEAAIRDQAYFNETRSKIIHTRETVTSKLMELGFTVIPSKANFLFARHPDYEGSCLFQRLREKGILVRHFNKPRIHPYLRISMGTDEEMAVLLKVFEDIIG